MKRSLLVFLMAIYSCFSSYHVVAHDRHVNDDESLLEQIQKTHPLWLRERCREPFYADPDTRQPRYNLHEEELTLTVASVEELSSGGFRVTFSDQQSCFFHEKIIRAELKNERTFLQTHSWSFPTMFIWDSESLRAPTMFDHDEILDESDQTRKFLSTLISTGLAMVKNVPREAGECVRFGERFSTLRETEWGKQFNVRSVPDTASGGVSRKDLAYTPHRIGMHVDNPYRMDTPPAFQLLHAIDHCYGPRCNVHNRLVDGFKVAEHLCRNNKEQFDALTSTILRWENNGGDDSSFLYRYAPMIELEESSKYIDDPNGCPAVRAINFSAKSGGYAPNLPHDQLELFYRAKRHFSALLHNDKYAIQVQLFPGGMIVFDNRRILHSRSEILNSDGERWLQGCYLNRDGVHYNLERLQRKFAIPANSPLEKIQETSKRDSARPGSKNDGATSEQVLPHPQLIVLFMTDQFRKDAFQPSITPNFYKLSQSVNATMFTNAYVSTPTCTPSRAGLLTGKSPWNHGMLGYAYTVNCTNYPSTLPLVLSELAGYETFSVGKNHFGWTGKEGQYVTHGFQHLQVYDAMSSQPRDDDYTQYFDHLHPGIDPLDLTCDRLEYNDWKACPYGNDKEEEHPTPWTTRQALEYLKGFNFSDGGNKMFLKVSYHRPHSPYDPPRRLLEKHLQSNIPKRIINNTSWDSKYLNTTEMTRADWHGDPGETAAQHTRAGYLASVEFVDEGVGELMHWLVQNGLFDDTMILWTSDHGDMNGDHNLWRKGYAYEGSSHVNLVAKLPSSWSGGRMKPAINAALVETRDIAVTLYNGLGVLKEVQGRDPLINGKSLLPLLKSPAHWKLPQAFRKWLDLEHSVVYRKDIHWNAIIGFDEANNTAAHPELWKYVYHVLDGADQLFCLTTDKEEMYDLSQTAEWKHMVEHWKSVMINQFLQEGRGTTWVKDGKLVSGRRPITLGTNFPCSKSSRQAKIATTY